MIAVTIQSRRIAKAREVHDQMRGQDSLGIILDRVLQKREGRENVVEGRIGYFPFRLSEARGNDDALKI